MNEYAQLEEFSLTLLNSELFDRDKYKFMLIKTLGIVNKKLKIETDNLLQQYYYKQKNIL